MTTTQTAGEQKVNALSVLPFRWLWASNISFFFVVNAQRFLFSWVVLDGLDRSEADQGLTVFLLGLPTLLLVLHAGAWSDRLDRRRILLGSQIATAVVLGAAASALDAGALTFGWLLVAALASGVATTIGHPVRSSLLPALVGPTLLYNAIAVNALAMTTSLVFGSVVVKVVGDAFGFAGAFWFLAAVMVAGAVAAHRITVPAHARAGDPRAASVLHDIVEGATFIWRHRELRALFALLTLSSMTVAPAAMVTQQAHVDTDMGRSAGAAAIPFMAMGIGIAITSTFIMRRGSMRDKGLKFQLAMISGGTATALIGLTDRFELAVALSFLMGLSGGFFINMNQGLIQAHAPAHLMGRVMGVYTLVSQGLFPVGALCLGLLAASIGAGAAMTVAGVIGVTLVTASILTNPRLRALS